MLREAEIAKVLERAARVADKYARQGFSGRRACAKGSEGLKYKNRRSGETGAAAQHFNRLGAYWFDRALAARSIAADIRALKPRKRGNA